ncbi:MAG: hypothetical protein ACPG6N_08010, partial [Flavobacteriales bacterium]
MISLFCAVLAQIEEGQESWTVVETMPVWGTCPESAGEGYAEVVGWHGEMFNAANLSNLIEFRMFSSTSHTAADFAR